ncbi:hypothetical protein DVP09_13870 [Yersinia enterocolitica]|nr:hypothetical protein [Yersinia enterocolitica]
MAALSDNNLISSHCAFSLRWFLLLMFFALSTAGLPWALPEDNSGMTVRFEPCKLKISPANCSMY